MQLCSRVPATRRALRRARPATEGAPARSRLDSAARPRIALVRVATAARAQEDATAAIKACAEKKKAMPVWQSASVDPFIGGKKAPSIVKREREIPADVQGCCCGSTRVPDDDPFPGPVPLP